MKRLRSLLLLLMISACWCGPAGALVAYQEAVRLAPKFAAAGANLGSALFAKGDRKAGFEEIRVAHELAPQNSQITALYEKATAELKRSDRPTFKR